MIESTILDHRGQPMKKRELVEEVAEAQLTGVRSVWAHPSVAGYLNPASLASILERAADGDHHDFLTLAEDMEERDLHYASVLGTRKRGLSGIEPEVEAASDDTRDVEIAAAVREQLVVRPDFGDLVEDLQDALGKGYSAVEIIWDTKSKPWRPETFKWRDPRFFKLDRVAGRELLLISDDNPMGEPLPAFKFIVHQPRLKSGLPVRGALARLAAVAYLCKGVALADWMTFAELFGMPVRVGKYGRNATAAEKATLRSAVASIGTDAAAIMPDTMKLEFIETGKAAGGEQMFERLCAFLDKQISKGIVGQTMTADDGSSQSQANVHNEIRKDILAADVRQLQNTLNQQLVKPFVDFNYGPQKSYPRISFPIVEPEDVVALTGALEKLVPLGLTVGNQTILDKLGLPEPKQDEQLLRAPPEVSKSNDPVDEVKTLSLNRESDPQPKSDLLDQLLDVEEELDDWQALMQPVLNPLESLLLEAKTPEEFKERLPELLGKMDSSQLLQQLAESCFKAQGVGDRFDKESID